MTNQTFSKLALAFPNTTEQPHFEKRSFRLHKKIFATLDEVKQHACIKLDEISQSVFSSTVPGIIYPVNNKWGKQGWTIVALTKVNKELVEEMLQVSVKLILMKK